LGREISIEYPESQDYYRSAWGRALEGEKLSRTVIAVLDLWGSLESILWKNNGAETSTKDQRSERIRGVALITE